MKFEALEKELFFQEAKGYSCVDAGEVPGIWGTNPEAFFFMNIRIHDLWPISQNIERYTENAFFSVVEFLFDYVSQPENVWYHGFNQCGWHSSCYDKEKGRAKYRQEINTTLKDYQDGYELSEEGLILKIAPSGMEPMFTPVISTADPQNIDDLVKCAILKFRRLGATLDEKKDAVRTLGDVLEYLKKAGVKLPGKDDSDIFNIINGFDIRHHNPEQKKNYDKEIWYDWLFFTSLASIRALLTLESKFSKKI